VLKSWLTQLGIAQIYGAPGIVLAEIFSTFPHALMILITSLAAADARLYEAADAMGTRASRKFFTITLPGAKYGLISAALVTFTLVITDFGIPKVIGGNFNVLATDVFKLVIGQQDFQRGAVVALLLLAPAALTFAVDALVQRKQTAMLSARAVPYRPKRAPVFDAAMGAWCLLVAVLPRLSAPPPAAARARATASGARTMVGAMSLLILVVAIRSWTQLGFTTFLPFYWRDVLHGDPRLVGTLLAVFLGSGAIGTLAAGPVADRVGVRRCVVGVFLLAAPLATAFLFVSGGPLVFILLAVLGFVLVSTFTMSVVLGQAYLPRNPGMASGLIVGFAIGAGGLGASALGWVADHWGLTTALGISAAMPLAGFVAALFLPDPQTGDVG